jgi:hypothetical protein
MDIKSSSLFMPTYRYYQEEFKKYLIFFMGP